MDPMPCRCPFCGAEGSYAVSALMSLSATCFTCGGSLREIGESMRRTSDDVANDVDATLLLIRLEAQMGFTIDEAIVDASGRWEDLTLRKLAGAVSQMVKVERSYDIDDQIRKAVRDEFPDAPAELDFDLRIVDAVSPRRHFLR